MARVAGLGREVSCDSDVVNRGLSDRVSERVPMTWAKRSNLDADEGLIRCRSTYQRNGLGSAVEVQLPQDGMPMLVDRRQPHRALPPHLLVGEAPLQQLPQPP